MMGGPARIKPLVLLCEDNPDDERLAIRALSGCGISLTVRIARDGEQALAALGVGESSDESNKSTPNLVICDVKMPKYNGDEVLLKARQIERLSDVPFVVFSSSDEESDVNRCLNLGASAYCVKPVDYDQYTECLKAIILRWLDTEPEPEPECLVKVGSRRWGSLFSVE